MAPALGRQVFSIEIAGATNSGAQAESAPPRKL